MRCEEAQDRLLHTENSEELAGHIAACTECQRLQQRIARLESAWRGRPAPAEASTAKAAFLNQLSGRPRPAAARSRWRSARRWVLAASVFLAVGAGALFLFPSGQVKASPDIVEQILDWNLDLSEALEHGDRLRLYGEGIERFRGRLAYAGLNQREREFGEALLANANWLVENDDPMEGAHRFDAFADQLLERMRTATQSSDDRFARQYRKVMERGIDGNLERVKKAAKALKPDQPRKVEKLLQRDAERTKALSTLVEKGTETTRKEIHQALKLAEKRQKKVEK